MLTESEYQKKIDNVLRVGLDLMRINTFSFLDQLKNQSMDAVPILQMAY